MSSMNSVFSAIYAGVPNTYSNSPTFNVDKAVKQFWSNSGLSKLDWNQSISSGIGKLNNVINSSTLNTAFNQIPGTALAGSVLRASSGPVVNTSGITVTNLNEADGTPDNKSRVVIPFSQNLTNLDPSKIKLQGAAADPGNKSLQLRDIPILSASIDPANPKNLIINTGQLVPKNAKLSIGSGALYSGNTAVKPQTVLTPSGSSLQDYTMANRAFKPKDVNLFDNIAFANASTVPTTTATGLSETTAKNQLTDLLNRKVSVGKMTTTQRDQALARFSSAATKAIIPDPLLRASLFTLNGTVASAAIDAVLTSNNQSGRPFASVDYDPNLVASNAKVTVNPDGSLSMKFRNSVKGDPMAAIGSLMAHEALHQDAVNGQQEEIMADAARTFAYAENLMLDPLMSRSNTEVVRENNTELLAMLNSGNRAFPKVGLTSAPQVQTGATPSAPKVFVGGNETIRSFEDLVRKANAGIGVADIDTPGNALLDKYMSAITKTAVTGTGFTRTAMQDVDRSQQVINNTQALYISSLLGLTLP